jgi:hypothetical protein
MNLLQLSAALRGPSAEIVILDESIANVGDHQDYFYSFCIVDGDLYSVNSRSPVLPYYKMGTPDFLDDQIYLTRYARAVDGLRPAERVALGRSADPRAVSDGRNAYAISILAEDTPKSGVVLGALLHDLRTRRTKRIEVEAENFKYGKNWQPYMCNGELFIVHELTPFRVLKVDVESGRARMVRELDISFKLPCFHTPYPMFRGGSNAVESKGLLLGLGRATSQRYRHHPFLWSMSHGGNLDILFTEFFYDFHRCGYNIIDPTSIFFDGDDFYLGLCCSERDWAHNQVVSHFLLRFPGPGSERRGEPLKEYFARRAITETRGAPNLDRHMFFCIEMPSAMSSKQEFGGRVSTGAAGHLVHGPYVRVEREGRFCAELSYLTKNCESIRAGVLDVTASRVSGGRQSDFHTLGCRELIPTNGGMAEAAIEFDTRGLEGALLEFRVYVDEGVELNAFHIRTWRVDGKGSRWPMLSRMEKGAGSL